MVNAVNTRVVASSAKILWNGYIKNVAGLCFRCPPYPHDSAGPVWSTTPSP